jgi:predicted permease
MRPWRNRAYDIDEEIATHIAMAIADRVASGESPEAARQAVRREFGNPLLVRETTHRIWVSERLEHITHDLRYAIRQMRRTPSFTLIVILSLGLGLGATLAMFTVVERVLLQILPYNSPRRLGTLHETGRLGDVEDIRWLDIQQWRQRARSFESIGFFTSSTGRAFIQGDTGAQQISHHLVSTNLFHVLGVSPTLGSGFVGNADDFADTGRDHTAILSDALWRESFGARPDIIGRTVKLTGESYTVVGVMPRGFTVPLAANLLQAWSPVPVSKDDSQRNSESPAYTVIARLRPRSTLASATAEMQSIQPSIAALYTDPYLRALVTSATVTSYGRTLVRPEVRRTLVSLFSAAALLWIIACTNVAGLLLSRGSTRQREIAVRGALGASRGRIIQQLLLEGLLLSIGGAALGLVAAFALLRLFAHGLSIQLDLQHVTPGWQSVVALIALTLLSALVSTLWPAFTAARASIEPALRQAAPQTGTTRAQHRTRGILVVTQIALSLVLLVSCHLLLRTIYTLRHVPLGFRTDNILVGSMAVPSYRFAGQDLNATLYGPLLQRVRSLPGVDAATLMSAVPLDNSFQMTFSFDPDANDVDSVHKRDFRARFRAIGPDAQRVFGFTMFRGRYFNQNDTASSQAVIVVNREFVKQFSQANDPDKVMGQSLMGFDDQHRAIVIGILDDSREISVAQHPAPEIEAYYPQIPPGTGMYEAAEGVAMDLALRTTRSPSSILPELRRIMAQASPELAHTEFTTMTQLVEDSYGSQQLVSRLLLVFGGSAILLCLSGLYGLLAQFVAQRTREIGVRVALGATRRQVLWLVLRQASRLLLAGAATGLAIAWFTSRLVSGLLYGVQPHDLAAMLSAALLLTAGGLMAASIPATRAAAINPVDALRSE